MALCKIRNEVKIELDDLNWYNFEYMGCLLDYIMIIWITPLTCMQVLQDQEHTSLNTWKLENKIKFSRWVFGIMEIDLCDKSSRFWLGVIYPFAEPLCCLASHD